MECAVKTLHHGASEQDQIKFLQEAAINGQFHHPNVVQLLGVVTLDEPVRSHYTVYIEIIRLENFLLLSFIYIGYDCSGVSQQWRFVQLLAYTEAIVSYYNALAGTVPIIIR